MASYAFLQPHDVAPGMLERAIRLARRWRCPPHTVLIALGWITAEAYAAALARHLGCEVCLLPDAHAAVADAVDVLAARPDEVAALAAPLRAAGRRPLLGLPVAAVRGMRLAPSPEDAALEAARGLKRRRPAESAATPMWLWQRLAIAMGFGLLAGGVGVAPGETLAVLLGLLAFPFVLVTVLRLLSVLHLSLPGWRTSHARAEAVRLPDDVLPIYTVLVPLYDEAEVVGDLVAALLELDYPADRLDILFLVEASDTTTRVRLNAERLPESFRVLVVPPGEPQTKPRALNFGMQFARGAFVVVYDAEDAPEPDQLRRAFAVLRERPEEIGCVQARLNIYNTRESWLTRGIMAQTPPLSMPILLEALLHLCTTWPVAVLSGRCNVAVLFQAFPKTVRLSGWVRRPRFQWTTILAGDLATSFLFNNQILSTPESDVCLCETRYTGCSAI